MCCSASNAFAVCLQILYYAVLGVTPRYDKESSSFLLSAHSLPHVINPVEARLGEHCASGQALLRSMACVPSIPGVPHALQPPMAVRATKQAVSCCGWRRRAGFFSHHPHHPGGFFDSIPLQAPAPLHSTPC